MEQALWETLYLSGARPNEIAKMKVGDVRILQKGVEIVVRKSKTKTRKIPLSGEPKYLLRWLGNHPFRDDPEYPLWLSFANQSKFKQLHEGRIYNKLKQLVQRAELKNTIMPKSFRKTRATIMFREYDDTMMAQLFGWSLNTVAQRRQDYDLSNYEDLQEKVFGKSKLPETFDSLMEQKQKLETEFEDRMKKMQEQMKK